ncbi:MAG TPA: RyR domain-containing protein [Ignavibacteriaceae bacterium]|nr:RyR domain-containing protein [Ignavibacteriaceae bacterium]HPO56071.1 RyR domain-containing protein [Ignavibacteriaceae bacterium]
MEQSKFRLKEYEWHLIGLAAILVFLIGVIGFRSAGRGLLDAMYLSIQLFVLQSGDVVPLVNNYLQLARFAAPLITAYATIKSVVGLFQKNLGLMFLKNHIVICGLSNKSLILLRDVLSKKMKVVLIEPGSDQHSLLNLRTEGTIWINEHPADITALRKASVKKAKAVFLLNDSDELNIEIVTNIYNLFGSGLTDKRVLCYVQIYQPLIEEIFKSHQIFLQPNDMLDSRIVNVYKRGSEILINEYPLISKDFSEDKKQLKIMMLGFGKTGKSILIQAALLHHYSYQTKLLVTVIDKNAQKEINSFRNDYPSIYELIELDYEETEIEKLTINNFRTYLSSWNYESIFICLTNDVLSYSLVKQIGQLRSGSNIFVAFQRNSNLTQLISEGELLKRINTVKYFNIYEKTCLYDQLVNEEIEKIAEIIHQKYVESETQRGITKEQNKTLVDWDSLPHELKEANRQQAFHIKLKLNSFGYDLVPVNHPPQAIDPAKDKELLEKMAKAEHIRWMDEKLLNGWRYAPGEKNLLLKTHPDIIPYEELDEEAKEKDRQTIKNLPDLLKLSGKKIIKNTVNL